jgi:methylisocitrate lyase
VHELLKHLKIYGISGCHIEDQVNPKRCGHLDNKDVVSVSEMVKKIKSASKSQKR